MSSPNRRREWASRIRSSGDTAFDRRGHLIDVAGFASILPETLVRMPLMAAAEDATSPLAAWWGTLGSSVAALRVRSPLTGLWAQRASVMTLSANCRDVDSVIYQLVYQPMTSPPAHQPNQGPIRLRLRRVSANR